MILRFELITNRDDGLDVLFTSQPKLFPNSPNVHVYGPCIAKSLMSPNRIEQLIARKNPVWVLDEKFQETEILQGQLRLTTRSLE